MIGLLLQNADLGLRADEADIELRSLDDHPRADDGDDRGGDPGPFDAADRVEDEPVERHERDQIGGQAEDDEIGAGHFDAGRFAERRAGGVGRGAEIVPSADAARVLRRLIFLQPDLLAAAVVLRIGDGFVVDILETVSRIDAQIAGEVAELRVERGIEAAVLQFLVGPGQRDVAEITRVDTCAAAAAACRR